MAKFSFEYVNFGAKVSLLFFRASAEGDIWFFIIGFESPANTTKELYKIH